MHQPLLVGIVQAPGKLDRYIQDSLKGFIMSPFIQPALLDPVRKAPPFNILSKNPGNTPQRADIITTHYVRMKTEVYPGLRLADEILFLFLGLEVIRPGALYGQVDVPAAVADPIDQSHTAALMNVLDLIKVQDHIADVPFKRDLSFGCPNLFRFPGESGGYRSLHIQLRPCPGGLRYPRLKIRLSYGLV